MSAADQKGTFGGSDLSIFAGHFGIGALQFHLISSKQPPLLYLDLKVLPFFLGSCLLWVDTLPVPGAMDGAGPLPRSPCRAGSHPSAAVNVACKQLTTALFS